MLKIEYRTPNQVFDNLSLLNRLRELNNFVGGDHDGSAMYNVLTTLRGHLKHAWILKESFNSPIVAWACLAQKSPLAGYIYNIYVDSAHRKRGFGRKLLWELDSFAEVHRLRVTSVPWSDAGFALYQHSKQATLIDAR